MMVVFDYTESCIKEYSKTSSALVFQASAAPLPFGVVAKAEIKSDLDLRALEAFQFDFWLRAGLDLLLAIKQLDSEYRSKVDEGKLKFSKDFARRIHYFYEEWYANCPRMIEGIESFGRQGFPLDNADEYRQACDKGIMSGLENTGSVGQRRGKSLVEVENDIRRRTFGGSRKNSNRRK
jgi:hypothetical protein